MTTKTLTKTSLIQLGVAIAIALSLAWIFRGDLGMDAIDSASQGTRDRAAALDKLIKDNGGSGITLDRYKQVQTGMSISKVETIVGEGVEMSRVDTAGVPLTIRYKWQNADGSNMSAMFKGNKLISKAQALLK